MKSTKRMPLVNMRTLTLGLAALTLLSGCNMSSQDNASVPESELMESEQKILVSNKQAFAKAAKNIKAGQHIVLANGTWEDFQILLKGTGTKEKPIKLSAQTEGKVILSGLSNLSLQGEYLEVSGLVFKDGYSPTGTVISFRGKAGAPANHSRVTRTVIDSFSSPERFSSDTWINMYGKYNRFDHNHIEGKANSGVTMAVRLNDEANQENYHRIDHNYFGPRQILGSNGGETLRIGTSKYSLTDSFTSVENNYFDRANGEVEIISNKSGKNTFRGNVFFESRGTLTLRHGNGNVVENNVFFGNGKDHTGGIRVINADQTIRNNYMQGLTGIRFGGALVILNGVPNSPINRYHQVDNAVVENNTLVDVDNINLAAASDAERSAIPINSVFKNNLIVNTNPSQAIKIFDDMSGIKFENNLMNIQAPSDIAYGFEFNSRLQSANQRDPETGLITNTIAANNKAGASLDLKPISRAQTGVDWYPKPGVEISFNQGRTISVSNEQALFDAVANAKEGDRIELDAGEYNINIPLKVSTMITIAGQNNRGDVVVYPMRSYMVDILDGGSISLENLTIDGKKSPDSAGNVLIRNSRIPTILNYKLNMINLDVKNLNVNHSHHVFDAGYRSLADSINIVNSNFNDITGDVLRLNKEQDDLGIYNVEYLTIKNSNFSNIQGALAKVYRGGTDESTFGPHVLIQNSNVKNVGYGKRNKSKAALYLHGVQDTDLLNNTFVDSQAITIEHTVGEPQTLLKNNQFKNTKLSEIVELFAGGESTAMMEGNSFED